MINYDKPISKASREMPALETYQISEEGKEEGRPQNN